ncbi:uncharacterized protein LOC121374496 [Gigantopelta aegis]|uniref:uncharacterized protein LOC121374496 n=1 Tax=Gigantopelta aegis TaxID=1735272 RepID=UPI001B88BBF7|nr:uncharacterized protein LOC121374496 [Gigantopelta aegis]
MTTETSFAPSPSYFMCRVVFPSESGAKSWLAPDEICWREIVEYRTSDRNDNSVLYLQLLFMDKPNRFQELVVKHFRASDDIMEITPQIFSNTIEDKEQFAAAVSIKLNHRGLLVLCCRPRTERIPVLPSGGNIVSKLNESIQLDFPSQAFSKPGNVILAVDEVSKVPQTDHILSLSHFFNVRHSSGSDPVKDVTVTLPTPDGFKGDGEVVIMSRSGSPAYNDDSDGNDGDGEYWQEKAKWKIMDVQPRVAGKSVSFKTSKLGLTSPVEVEKWATKTNIITDTARRYVKRSHQVICFMAVGKCLKYNTFDIVIECLHPTQCSRRLDEWAKDDYKKLRVSGDFHARQASKFRFHLHGNLSSVYTLQDLSLDMFPGQASHQSLILKVKDVSEAPTGNVAILKQGNDGLRLITHLPLFLQEQLLCGTSDNTLATDFDFNLSVDYNDNPQACAISVDRSLDNNDNLKDVEELATSLTLATSQDDSAPPRAPTVDLTEADDNTKHSETSEPRDGSDDLQTLFDFSDRRTLLSAQMLPETALSSNANSSKGSVEVLPSTKTNLPNNINNNKSHDVEVLPSFATSFPSNVDNNTVHGTEVSPSFNTTVSSNNNNNNNTNNGSELPSSTTFLPLHYDDDDDGGVRKVTNDASFKREIVLWLSQVIIDVWWKVGIYLGFSNQFLTEYDHRLHTGPLEKSKLLLTGYFQQTEHQEDLGLRKLVDTLHNVHKSDGINCIIEHLQAYQQIIKRRNNDDHHNSSRFSRWVVSQEISKATLFQQFDMPAPISDEFLVNLVLRLEPNFLLGIKLGLTHAETEHIRQDSSCIGLEYKMFTMLVKCRQKQGNKVSFFNSLLQTLKELELNETKEWIMEYTKKWSDNVSGIQKGFARQLLDIVRRYSE